MVTILRHRYGRSLCEICTGENYRWVNSVATTQRDDARVGFCGATTEVIDGATFEVLSMPLGRINGDDSLKAELSRGAWRWPPLRSG